MTTFLPSRTIAPFQLPPNSFQPFFFLLLLSRSHVIIYKSSRRKLRNNYERERVSKDAAHSMHTQKRRLEELMNHLKILICCFIFKFHIVTLHSLLLTSRASLELLMPALECGFLWHRKLNCEPNGWVEFIKSWEEFCEHFSIVFPFPIKYANGLAKTQVFEEGEMGKVYFSTLHFCAHKNFQRGTFV